MSRRGQMALGSLLLIAAGAAGWWCLRPAEEGNADMVTRTAPVAPLMVGSDPSPAGSVEVPEGIDPAPAFPIPTTPFVESEEPEAGECGSLTVRVIWKESKAPAPGVGVAIAIAPTGDGSLARRLRRATAGADGVARFARVPFGSTAILPALGGVAFADVETGKETTATVEIPSGGTIEGVVVDRSLRPVGGAVVWISDLGPHFGTDIATTAADGSFRIEGIDLQRGRMVGARAPGKAPSTRVVVTGLPGWRVNVRLILPGVEGRLRGSVEDAEGRPVAGARVRVGADTWVPESTAGGRDVWAPLAAETMSGDDGGFELGSLPAGTLPVVVAHRGFAAVEEAVEITESHTASLVVRLGPCVRLHGIVTGSARAPIAGAHVMVNGTQSLRSSVTETGADGRYDIQGVAAGKLRISVTANDGRKDQAIRQAAPGDDLVHDVVLQDGLTIRGTVVDERGVPLAGWSLEFRSEGALFDRRTALSVADGSFEVRGCCAPSYVLSVRAQDAAFESVRLEGVRPGPEPIVVTVSARDLPTCSVKGQVIGPAGTPAEFVRVTVVCGGLNPPLRETVVHPDPSSGRFECGPGPSGQWWVWVKAEGLAPWQSRRALDSGETWDLGEIRLERGGFLVVQLDARDLPRPPDAMCVAADSLRGQGCEPLVIDGLIARSETLFPGPWTVTAGGAGLFPVVVKVVVADGQETAVDLRLRAGVRLTIEIPEPAGSWPTALFITADVRALDGTGQTVADLNSRAFVGRESVRRAQVDVPRETRTIEVSTNVGLTGSATLDLAGDAIEAKLTITLR